MPGLVHASSHLVRRYGYQLLRQNILKLEERKGGEGKVDHRDHTHEVLDVQTSMPTENALAYDWLIST